MDITYYGGNCIRLTGKKASVIFDDNLSDIGLSSVTKPGEIALFTGAHGDPEVETKIVIDSPGEYEVSDVSIQGVAARSHIDEEGKKSAVMYKLTFEDIRVAVVGHVHPDLTEAQLEELGTVDVLLVPVGGNGYTLDAVGALKVIKEIEPKLVIPTHYDDGKIKYVIPQQDLESALKNLAMEPKETLPKLKLKAGELGEITQLVVLERS